MPGNKPLHLETLAAPMQIKKHHQLFLINHFIVFVCLFIIIDRSSAMGNEMQQLPFVGCEKMHRKNWKVEVISIRFEYYRCVDAFTIDATCSFEVDIAFQHFLWTIDMLKPWNPIMLDMIFFYLDADKREMILVVSTMAKHSRIWSMKYLIQFQMVGTSNPWTNRIAIAKCDKKTTVIAIIINRIDYSFAHLFSQCVQYCCR